LVIVNNKIFFKDEEKDDWKRIDSSLNIDENIRTAFSAATCHSSSVSHYFIHSATFIQRGFDSISPLIAML